MAVNDKKSFPMIAARAWWNLRDKFKRTIPTLVSASYVASALNMSETSANVNVIPALKGTGLIDDDGKPTDLSIKWRDDGQYKDACKKIISKVYPQELIDLGLENRDEVQRWFANYCRVGVNAAGKMASLYILLNEGDPTKAAVSTTKKTSSKSSKTPAPKPKEIRQPPPTKGDSGSKKDEIERKKHQIHFNIQVHISPESTPEQIDAIFSSMAKHLKSL